MGSYKHAFLTKISLTLFPHPSLCQLRIPGSLTEHHEPRPGWTGHEKERKVIEGACKSHKRRVCFGGVLFHGGLPRKQASSFTFFTCVLCIERVKKKSMGEGLGLAQLSEIILKIKGPV